MGSAASTIPAELEDEVRQFSHFPSKDIQEWSVSFKSEFSCGYITSKDLEVMFRNFFPFGSPANFSRRLFETINISQTATVDFHELLIAYSILVKGSNHEKLRWIFRFYDMDNDGLVSRAEMIQVAQYLIDMTSSTLEVVLDVEDVVGQIFGSLETERDSLTFEDFKSLATKNAELFKMLTLFSD